MRFVHLITIGAALIAALVHTWFFAQESLWFMRPQVWKRFGLASGADARIVRPWAINQGYYNLFLAVGIAVGLALAAFADAATGRVLVGFVCGSMIAAGVVLYRFNRRGAALQAVPPLVALAGTLFLG